VSLEEQLDAGILRNNRAEGEKRRQRKDKLKEDKHW
jgi:hypothetical protein